MHCLTAYSWAHMQYPINHKYFGPLFVMGKVVDVAYEGGIGQIIEKFPDYPYILTLEDDCLIPHTAIVQLMDVLKDGPYDGISAIYCRKEEGGFPHVYGDPRVPGDWSIRDVREAYEQGAVVECNAIPMGCSLYKRSLFEDVPRPWFQNVQAVEDKKNTRISQDLFFCRKAKEHGKRFAVHTGVKVGHIDVSTHKIYMPYQALEDARKEDLEDA